ncbi:hypothetical protein SRDD_01920 [Serratia sp. DD3]|nr:hypothetical protein SRDD_01920 [Serratia sp. DD3]
MRLLATVEYTQLPPIYHLCARCTIEHGDSEVIPLATIGLNMRLLLLLMRCIK